MAFTTAANRCRREAREIMAEYNFVDDVYGKLWPAFARPITVTPLVSQPGAPAYGARGYYNTQSLDIIGEGVSVISDLKIEMDIREIEFAVLPQQGDQIVIPTHQKAKGGTFLVLDMSPDNGQGVHTMTLRILGDPRPTT